MMSNRISLKIVVPIGLGLLVLGFLLFMKSLGNGDGELSIALMTIGVIALLISSGIAIARVIRRGASSRI